MYLSLSRGSISHTLYPSQQLQQVSNTYLLTIISSPSPVAKHREPATLVAIFSRGRVIIGRPAQRTSVPVVCALYTGLQVTKKNQHSRTYVILERQDAECFLIFLRVQEKISQGAALDVLLFHCNICENNLVWLQALCSSLCNK